ncbi:DMT family transporter [Gymnodinialimonas sp. 2305UL16-5]|uniref:DMT family transporter n=1 Tax=Gymnodinialimonas mytili TaxID=3126503 RepID=UPI0030B0DBDB
MARLSPTFLASGVILAIGFFWGLYWVPIRALEDLGLTGAWGTLAVVSTAALILAPFAILRRHSLARIDPLAAASVILGGFAFALFSVGLIYGRVAIVLILFYLTPVWSTLIARYVLGWTVTRSRLLALGLGLGGMVLVLGSGTQLPVPRGMGDWLGLIAGLLFSISSTGIRTRLTIGPQETGFLFVLGACLAAGILAPLLAPLPQVEALGPIWDLALWTLAAGGLWWGGLMSLFIWASTKLEPARVGILLMIEVLVGAASAALFAGEALSAAEWTGGLLVLAAGVAEVWRRSQAPGGELV